VVGGRWSVVSGQEFGRAPRAVSVRRVSFAAQIRGNGKQSRARRHVDRVLNPYPAGTCLCRHCESMARLCAPFGATRRSPPVPVDGSTDRLRGFRLSALGFACASPLLLGTGSGPRIVRFMSHAALCAQIFVSYAIIRHEPPRGLVFKSSPLLGLYRCLSCRPRGVLALAVYWPPRRCAS
jgi:hypothetical protein